MNVTALVPVVLTAAVATTRHKANKEDKMSHRTLKSKLFGTIGGLAVAGMVLAGVATITAFTASSPQAATLGSITPPPLPDGMAPVPEGNKLFLGTHAVGTQNYVCQPSGAGVAYVLFTPQATLFGAD